MRPVQPLTCCNSAAEPPPPQEDRPVSLDPPFNDIRDMCESNKYDTDIATSPLAFAEHRRRSWPFPAASLSVTSGMEKYAAIYDVVRATGVPNCISARTPLPINLNIQAWQSYIDHDTDEAELLDYVTYGFPLGYMGPASHTTGTPNHNMAEQHPTHVDDFIQVEMDAGALLGPFASPPFTPWAHVSPIMTRPKADSSQRRVITDLTFPREKSINAYIMKNSALGIVRDHSLPSISDLVGELRHMGQSAYMFTLDIARAYKNFMSDPLDWPLLCVQWKGKYYVETSMPFGSRASSCFMQRVANFITRVLRSEGIIAIMYLDDVIVISPDRTIADTQYARVRELLAELGLPEAVDKAQPPAQAVRWLGVDIDAVNMSLSIPNDKLKEVMLAVDRYHNARSINKRQLQSLVGKLVNVAKCVDPARAFIARLLDALRAFGDRQFIKVTQEMRADLQWFREFVNEWNGTSLIPAVTPHKIIQVDGCLTGIGATDGTRAYAACVAPESDPISSHLVQIRSGTG